VFNANPGQQSNPQSAYSQLAADALPQVAQIFMQHFQQVPDQQAQQYAQMNPNNVTPALLAEMHQYAGQNHPGLLGQIMQHPQVASALGGFAEREVQNYLGGSQGTGNAGGFRL
jgi:hypothetical protein